MRKRAITSGIVYSILFSIFSPKILNLIGYSFPVGEFSYSLTYQIYFFILTILLIAGIAALYFKKTRQLLWKDSLEFPIYFVLSSMLFSLLILGSMFAMGAALNDAMNL